MIPFASFKEIIKRFRYHFSDSLDGDRGQVGVIILLLSIILLTVGLSIASRSVTDVRLSRQEEETSRAFDAAEAGIEDALRKNLSALVSAPVSERTIDVGGINAVYNVGEERTLETTIEEGATVEVNLIGFSGTQVSIEWAEETCPTAASIVMSVYNSTAGTVRRTPYKGCDRVPNDYFVASSPAVSPGFRYRVLVNVNSGAGDEFVRIRAVYNATRILVNSSNPGSFPLPVQIWRVHSEAQAMGGETRAVEVTQTIPAPPSLFDFVLFSGSNLVKN